jgi:trk system potassium uptake protein TrkH
MVVLIGVAGGLLTLLEGRPIEAFFDAATATTTTGFSVDDVSAWSASRKAVITLLMTVGGPTGSSAGGMKILRLLWMASLVQAMLFRMLLPERAVVRARYRGDVVSSDTLLAAAATAASHLLLLVICATAYVAAGEAPVDAAFESASAIGTVGLSAGVTSASAPAWMKALLAFEMWAGRLDVLVALAILHPNVWRRSK